MSDEALDNIERLFLREKILVVGRDRTPAAVKLKQGRSAIADQVREVGKSGDINLILAVERRFLENDQAEYANSRAMANSLKAAMTELAAAETSLPLVNDPTLYQAVNESHGHPKSRIGGVPNDAPRRFFKSNDGRLLNMDKSRLDAEEKKIVEARKQNMREAAKLYTVLQRKALGIEAPRQERSQGLGR